MLIVKKKNDSFVKFVFYYSLVNLSNYPDLSDGFIYNMLPIKVERYN